MLENRWPCSILRGQSRGWGSKKTRKRSVNLRGKPEALKQASWDAIRVWWVPVLARGKLHLELLGDEFPGENAQGAAILAAKVRAVLNIRVQGSTAPRVLFTDRGRGFYHQVNGSITKEYKAALDAHSLRAYYGDNASAQPGNLQDVLLHETAVAWVRLRETVTQPRQLWKETLAEYGRRLRGIAQCINANYSAEELCKELPARLRDLVDNEGVRLAH